MSLIDDDARAKKSTNAVPEKSIPEVLREKYPDEKLREILNRGKMAKAWKELPYSQLLLDGFKAMVIEFEIRKNSIQLKSFLLNGGHEILSNMVADEETSEAYKSIVEGIELDIRYGIYAEQALAIPKIKK